MEILVAVVVLVLLTAGATVVALRRSSRRVELEPPPAARATPEAPPPQAPAPEAIEVEPEVPPADEMEELDAIDDALVAEVEEALADVAPEPDVLEPEVLEPEVIEPEVVEPEVEAPPVTPSFRERLAKARGALAGYVGSVRSRGRIDQGTWDELEEALILADVGVTTTTEVLDQVRATVEAERVTHPDEVLDALKAQLKAVLAAGDRALRHDAGAPNVWLFVGVNGVGKTTTIGKVAKQQAAAGRSIVMAAGDTFRAAAAEQLTTWAERTGADIVRGTEGGDPSSVIFDAVQRAGARDAELVLADTAGRLHTKTNLMEELRKVRRVADREPGRVTEVLLVLDATTGQNGLVQATQFTEAVDLTGVVLTKLDGSAKGGIALAVQSSLGIPIKLVGLGESVDDLVAFDPDEFVEALFS